MNTLSRTRRLAPLRRNRWTPIDMPGRVERDVWFQVQLRERMLEQFSELELERDMWRLWSAEPASEGVH